MCDPINADVERNQASEEEPYHYHAGERKQPDPAAGNEQKACQDCEDSGPKRDFSKRASMRTPSKHEFRRSSGDEHPPVRRSDFTAFEQRQRSRSNGNEYVEHGASESPLPRRGDD